MANSVDEAYYQWLSTQTAITTLATVYSQEAPTGISVPYMVFWKVDDPNDKQHIGKAEQGVARMQHDIWVKNKALGASTQALVRRTVDALKTTTGGYTMYTEGVSEQILPRAEATEPYHYVVDAVVRWRVG